ncbi:MAG: recombinase family protein [Frisingicoccus sp.]
MPRVSKRKKNAELKETQIKYYRTYIYLRLSNKNGGHGREDTIYIQKQVCMDFAGKHPELIVEKVYADNGVTGTTFERPEFELLMEDVRAGKVDCIIVKDFSRFGRDALDAVDLIDVVFPSLNVRFISVLDDYDSENPACTQDRVTHILTHFMNDYYAREVSGKLAQAHKISREKGEYWGARPPYGYERSPESSKKLIPEETEKGIVCKIFYWFVFEDMSSYDIAKQLNAENIPSPSESYEIRRYKQIKKEKRRYWRSDYIRRILQNPVYIGCAVYGKTKQNLCENLPLFLVPKNSGRLKRMCGRRS